MIPPRSVTQDQWLDQVTRRRTIARRLWYGYVRYPRRWAKQFIRFLLTTPGKMTTMVVLLSVIITSAGWSMSTMAAERRASFDTLINNTEPVNYVAQSLYANLSAADTAASSSFVLVGDASSQSRSDYARSYQRAGKAIAQAATGFNTGDPELALLENLSQKLPVYTGLVETAWANNQQGNPVGVAYMSEASTLMREDLLPAASQLNVLTGQNVDKQQKALTEPLWVPLTGLVVALIALLMGQIWLAGITNRRLNRGMLCASVLMVVATLWGGTANAITWRTGSLGYERAAAPLNALTDARVMAQQARTQEMLALVWRQSLEDSTNTFEAAAHSVEKTLAGFSGPTADAARVALGRWVDAHNHIIAALDAGDYERAQRLALQTNEESSYPKLDSTLATLIDATRGTMRSYINQGIAASTFVSTMVLILSLLSVFCLWLGIRPRLQEYL